MGRLFRLAALALLPSLAPAQEIAAGVIDLVVSQSSCPRLAPAADPFWMPFDTLCTGRYRVRLQSMLDATQSG